MKNMCSILLWSNVDVFYTIWKWWIYTIISLIIIIRGFLTSPEAALKQGYAEGVTFPYIVSWNTTSSLKTSMLDSDKMQQAFGYQCYL